VRVRLVTSNEENLRIALNRRVWGSNVNRFRQWTTGDHLLFVVDGMIAAAALPCSEPFRSEDPLWPDGTYSYRIRIQPVYWAPPSDRPELPRQLLRDHMGRYYGIAIRDMKLLTDSVGQKLLGLLDLTGDPTALHQIPDPAATAEPTAEDVDAISGETATDDPHLEAMYYLKKMGLALGCDVYVATNDRGRVYNEDVLGEGCVPDLSGIRLPPEATRIIQYIDLLWMQRRALLSAFEVEISTGVYPGILRMSDLMVEVPNLQLGLYVVSPDGMYEKFRRHLVRPTFVHTGIAARCKFIPFSELPGALSTARQYRSDIQPSFIDRLAREA